MRSSVSSRPELRRGTVPAMAKVAVVAMALVVSSLCLPMQADARTTTLHYHRKHRIKHRRQHHRAASNDNGHIAMPPAALPPDVDGDPPVAEPAAGFPPDVKDALPPQHVRGEKPCPPSRPSSNEASAGAPRSAPAPARPPALSLSKPPSLSPAKEPSHSRAKSPSYTTAEPPSPRHAKAQPRSSPAPAITPSLSPAKEPSHSHAKSPSHSLAEPPSLRHAPAPSTPSRYSPTKAPAPSLSPSKPPFHVRPPKLASSEPPMPSPPARSPQLSPASPPVFSTIKPPQLAPARPPTKAPALAPTNPPSPDAKNGSSSSAAAVLDVRAFGASGNGSDDDTRAFRAAWKAACKSDNATLLVPSDGVFTITSTIFVGPCKPGLTFQIDGVLMPPDGPSSWPASDSRRQWIVFYKADGVTLAGKGTIEGNGVEWWDLPCKPHRGPNASTLPGPCDSPALIRFFVSNDVTVRGLRIENSPQFHLKFDACNRVRVDGLFVSSPAFSPNTDGIHVENTTAVQILNSRIYNGDDCVSIGSGCSGVHIENVTCGHGHGISIGSLGVRNTRACVSNVTVRNARILDSDNGVRIKTWQGGAGAVTDVEFAGIHMQNVKNCIVIDQYYCLGVGCANQSSAVRVAGVAYRDIRGTYNPRAGAPIRLACSDAVACTDITMAGVELVPASGTDGSIKGAQVADPFSAGTRDAKDANLPERGNIAAATTRDLILD
ncbi:hypothetical protein PR202_gb20446 [Eleusine coracana subsp. coracana]|uniref:Polygalacturonase n=1 Tax=Eleusine coracana subsp. coracana TaxID=191504 RepID=A0AAV5FCK6_ELECO|nr:hypothetical protein PR202_gb20446 [Eleusine coracana subsp. coracana]